jgi:hypothetical protein
MTESGWRSGEVLAWTEGDGPGQPPSAGSRRVWLAIAGALTAVFVGMLTGDTLCPEHRAWVMTFGTIGLVSIVGAIVGLVRGWGMAPVLTLVATVSGMGIGLFDAAHAPGRGWAIAATFTLLTLGAAWLASRQLMLFAWERRVRADLRQHPVERASEATTHSAQLPRTSDLPDEVDTPVQL